MRKFCALLFLPFLYGTDWAQWRGPLRNGSVKHRIDFEKLPESLTKDWDIEVGTGYSAPLIFGARVYVFARQGVNEVVMSLNRADGTIVWKAGYPAPFTRNKYALSMQDGPFATPLLYDESHLITWGVTGVLSCFDPPTGRLLWRNDYSAGIKTDNLFTGIAASPAGSGGRIYVHVGDDRGGRFLALNVSNGRELWATQPGAGPGYASPIIHSYRGVPMLITLTNQSVIALDERDGRPLWSFPFKDQWMENIVTPIAERDSVVVSGVRNGTFLLRMEIGEDRNWKVRQIWQSPDTAMYMSSPVLDGDTLFVHSSKKKGQFAALDFANGMVRWQTDGRDASSASIIQTDNALLITTVEGDLLVARKNKERFNAVKRYKVADSAVWSHSAFAGGELLIKDSSRLRKYRGL